MALTVEMQNTGDPGLQREVVATIEHVLADRPGNWRVSIVGSQANDKWEMKITGPNASFSGRANDSSCPSGSRMWKYRSPQEAFCGCGGSNPRSFRCLQTSSTSAT